VDNRNGSVYVIVPLSADAAATAAEYLMRPLCRTQLCLCLKC